MLKYNKLVIQPLPEPEEDEGPIFSRDLVDPDLPIKPQFMCCLVGMRGSGKSTLIYNLFRYFNNHFREQDVILFSPSLHTDRAMELIPSKHKYDHFKSGLILSVIEQQKALIKSNRYLAPDLLAILDDCITERSFEKSGLVELLGYRGRHLKISCIFSIQKYSACSRGIRLNCTHYAFYKTHNKSELKWIVEEHSDKDNAAAFKKMLEYCWSTPYSFLLCDYWTTDDSQRYRKNLDEPIQIEQFL